MLHEICDFLDNNFDDKNAFPSYYYEGICPQTGELFRLPRTRLSEAIAQGLMQQLAKDEHYFCEGKMYGILLVELPNGEQRVLKAFSGLLNAQSEIEGWVPPISGREKIALEETRTLTELETIKQELIRLKNIPEREEYQKLFDQFEQQLSQLTEQHQICKKQRQEKRALLCQNLSGEALNLALEELTKESQLQGIERRKFKQNQKFVLQPLKQKIEGADQEIYQLKKQRKILSRQLQTQMHLAYSLRNFSGQTLSLQELMPVNSIPTGTGDCCAPKLLNYAATHNLKPLAMAEFWWGPASANQDKIQGLFYGACAERCQPIMGFLLSGLNSNNYPQQLILSETNLPVIYEDEWLIAINKPSGLLSVPGRYSDKQDSVLSRLRHLLSDGNSLLAVHRLDQETSGILLFARNVEIYRQISRQFQNRQVEKIYEAILAGTLQNQEGLIDLPLWGDPENRPYQKVDIERGKPSLTKFRVIGKQKTAIKTEFFNENPIFVGAGSPTSFVSNQNLAKPALTPFISNQDLAKPALTNLPISFVGAGSPTSFVSNQNLAKPALTPFISNQDLAKPALTNLPISFVGAGSPTSFVSNQNLAKPALTPFISNQDLAKPALTNLPISFVGAGSPTSFVSNQNLAKPALTPFISNQDLAKPALTNLPISFVGAGSPTSFVSNQNLAKPALTPFISNQDLAKPALTNLPISFVGAGSPTSFVSNQNLAKPALTPFISNQDLAKPALTRVEFLPLTGRTHQLRVHSADFRGLGIPILGDFLYGYSGEASRLHLHARELRFEHPHLKKIIHLQTTTPF